MKTITLWTALFSSIIFSILPFAQVQAASQSDEFVRKIHEEFTVSASTLLYIQNKYGKVHVENGASGSIAINVELVVDASNQAEADAFFNKILIEFEESPDKVSAITNLDGHISKNNFSINYYITMPVEQPLSLVNRYGDVFIDKATGEVNIDVQYGTLKANSLLRGDVKPRNLVKLAYADNCSITECDWLKLDISYSELSVSKSTALITASRYSELNFRQAKSIVCDSKYDSPFKIGEVENFICTGQYSDYEVNKLTKMAEMNVKYCNVELEEVMKDFETISIDIKFGKLEITVDPAASYTLNADTEYCNLDSPSAKGLTKVVDRTVAKVNGTVGAGNTAASQIKILSKYGDVDIN